MRNVSQQSALRLYQRFDAAGHDVKITPQMTNLVTSHQQLFIHARSEFAVRKFLGYAAQFFYRCREISRQPVTEHAADEKDWEKIACDCKQSEAKRSGSRWKSESSESRLPFV